MKSVFEYLDHREYIKDYYLFNKKENGLSYRSFSKSAGFSSPVFIKLVIEGKTKLSSDSISKLCRAMGLKKEARKYFKSLVFFGQAENIDKKMKYLSEMKVFSGSLNLKQINSDQIEFYQNWYHPVVRELLDINPEDQSAKAIANLLIPSVDEKKIAESIEILKRLNLLSEDEAGKLRSENNIVSTDGLEFGSLVIRATQKKLAELAGESLDNVSKEERDISGLTIAMKQSSVKMVSEEIKKCRRRIIELLSDEKNPERVYRLNFHLFPLSKKADRGENHD